MSTASVNVWTIKTSAGVEQSCAAWGLSNPVITKETAGQDKATFTAVVAAADGAEIFNDFDTATLFRTDPVTSVKVPWFYGIWTRTPRDLAPTNEAITYELSGAPWWYLSHCTMQVNWNVTNGVTTALSAQLKPFIIIGLNPALETIAKIDLFTFLTTALDYCLTVGAAQGVTPFVIGAIEENDFIVPYEQVKNLTCAQLILHILKWIPDASLWLDYSTTVTAGAPTLNLRQRASLATTTLAAYGGVVSKINKITPRTDLLITGVVCKYDQTNTIDGQPYRALLTDAWPAGTTGLGFRDLIASVDLQGGDATYQHQKITTVSLPTTGSGGGSSEFAWVKANLPIIFGTTGQASIYDIGGITLTQVYATSLDPSDPANSSPPTGFNAAALDNQLTSGAVTPWMNGQGVFAALLDLPVQLSYSGSDAATKALFSADPNNPNTLMAYFKVMATNGSNGTYTQLTSLTPSEPKPVGLAQNLYNAASVLQFEGGIELTEAECSGLVPLGTVLNLTGGLAAWSTMNAQVIRTVENLEAGTTSVTFGPLKTLALGEYVDLLRAARGRIPTYKTNEAVTGNGSNSDVVGHTQTPHISATIGSAGGSSGPNSSFSLEVRVNPSDPSGHTFQGKIYLNSNLYKSPNLYDNVALTGLDTWFQLLANDTIWMLGVIDSTGIGISGNPTIHSYGQSSGDYNGSAAPWTSGGIVENDGMTPPNQTVFRIVLATTTADSGGKPVVNQRVNSDLVMSNTTIDGLAAFYPRPF